MNPKEEKQTMTREEIRAFYDKLEKNNDPYFFMLPFPDFMIKENPEKYGGMTKEEWANYENIAECEKIAETDPERAKEFRKEFLNKITKPLRIKKPINSRIFEK